MDENYPNGIPLSELRPFIERDYLLRAVVTTSGRQHTTDSGKGRAAGDSDVRITRTGLDMLLRKGELTLRPEKADEAKAKFGLLS